MFEAELGLFLAGLLLFAIIDALSFYHALEKLYMCLCLMRQTNMEAPNEKKDAV
ncbi:MAG: hypothetical protein JXR25_06725 [Pontiellaceae bacterium]|nr:hypothetical protein [Pontiellaceae bacterium]MBN2784504.1 hypothetical protein [Pontiellaceae bacterium]